MVLVCCYFQVHQPFRIKKNFDFFKIGTSQEFYEDDKLTADILRRVAYKSYLPANELLLKLIHKHKGNFKVAISLSGLVLEQFERFCPEVLESFKKLVNTGCVEILSESYYHSLAFFYSKSEFKKQILIHKKKIKEIFGVNPKTFRYTELVYNNNIAKEIEDMGYSVILAEGADQLLGWRSPNFVYVPSPCYKLKLLLRNYRLSDDIAFRFSNKGWVEYPLTAKKYASWLHNVAGAGEVINLFMDYETFGEHQWADTGIFKFLEKLPSEVLKHPDFRFCTPSEVIKISQPISKIDCVNTTSWADMERDLSAWLGNSMQRSAAEFVYSLEHDVLATQDINIIHAWRKLLCSDHLYYMSTKWFSDGDVHKYFNPFPSPYDAFVCYVNAVNHLKEVVKKVLESRKKAKIKESQKKLSSFSRSEQEVINSQIV